MNQTTVLSQDARDVAGPKYKQIRSHLAEQMRAGRYVPTEPLPGQRELAVSMGVALGTLRRALRGLESEGFIRQVPGKGTFVNSPQEQHKHARTDTFSVILPSVSEIPYPTLIEGLQQMAVEIDHQVVVGSSDNDLAKQGRLIRLAIDKKVAGLVIVPTTQTTPPEQIRLLETSRIPIVFCHRAIPEINAPFVSWSFEELGRLTADTLVQHGHRRIISLINVRYDYPVRVTEHIRSTLESHGIDKSNYRVHYHGEIEDGDKRRRAVHETLEQMLQEKNRPTAIQCFALQDAELVYVLADEFGLKIPEDLSLVCFAGSRPTGVLARRIASITRDESEIGREAGILLNEMCSHGMASQDGRRIDVPLTLLSGETVGAAPTA